ncbi:TipJ family phage tail tip protein [Shinella sp. M31]|uniref:TipJ family phage tail tip protein n=1 Tax=Shinella sp. M31 TaxID=3368615 RepID=UPI003B9E1A1B
MTLATIPVIAAPIADPGLGRIRIVVPVGTTIAEMVEKTLPGLPVEAMQFVRVTMTSRRRTVEVEHHRWHKIKPKAHVTVVIRPMPGKDSLRSILQIVISIAAIALGQYWGASLAASWNLGTTGTALLKAGLSMGLNAIGMLALNALVPIASPDGGERKTNYTISGWKNRLEPNGVIPDPIGKHRYAPPFAVPPFATMRGDDMWITGAFLVGYGSNDPAGGVAMSDFKIGDTSLSEFDPDTYILEVREGLPDDDPLSLVAFTTYQEPVGAELTRPFPRDEKGEPQKNDPTIETPVVRSTGSNATGASFILTWQGGLGRVDKKGRYRAVDCVIRIRQKLTGTVEWQEVETLNIRAKKLGEGFSRQHSWQFPSRGIWDIELTRMTDEHLDAQTQSRCTWEALQTIRPEYPINSKKPLALVALHMKATHQLNGTLDNFNLIVSRRCKDFDTATGNWVWRESSNPSACFRYKMQSLAVVRPAPDSGIDIETLEDWHDFCRLKGLKYDRVQDDSANHLERLVEIARAGRAAQRHDGLRRTVIIDRPSNIPIDEVSPRNAGQISVKRVYLRPPHAFRVTFNDATNNYEPSERWIRWPGYEGEMTITEQLALPGKTDPVEIFVEATRRMYEAIYRQDVITYLQSGASRVATRGDHVMMSLDTFDEGQRSARVLSIEGRLIELDDAVTMVAGKSYGILFRAFADEDDDAGMTVMRTVATDAGDGRVLRVSGAGAMPKVGEAVYFGEAGKETSQILITSVESGVAFSGYYRAVPAAPIIDELTDAREIEPWDSRVGIEIGENFQQPAAPRFVGIDTGFVGTGDASGLSILVAPGTGPIYTARYVLEHRLLGAPGWVPINFPSVAGGCEILSVYSAGQHVQLRVKGLSLTGVEGPYGPVVEVVVGGADLDVPGALDTSTISVSALLGGALIAGTTTDDAALTHLQLYHSTTGSVNTSTDAVGEPVVASPSRPFSISHGDTTRTNLAPNSTFDNATGVTLGPGWSIVAGAAKHVGPTAGGLSEAIPLKPGKFYRIAVGLSAVTAGTLQLQLIGGSPRPGATLGANGDHSDRIQAVTGNNAINLAASATFAGSADNLAVFEETATSLAAGTHYYWLEPLNDDGVAGPLAGPFIVIIR